jgi:hypothetical protein
VRIRCVLGCLAAMGLLGGQAMAEEPRTLHIDGAILRLGMTPSEVRAATASLKRDEVNDTNWLLPGGVVYFDKGRVTRILRDWYVGSKDDEVNLASTLLNAIEAASDGGGAASVAFWASEPTPSYSNRALSLVFTGARKVQVSLHTVRGKTTVQVEEVVGELPAALKGR